MNNVIIPSTSTGTVEKRHSSAHFEVIPFWPPQISFTKAYRVAFHVNATFLPTLKRYNLSELQRNIQILNSFKTLSQNWNDNNANPFDEELINKVIAIVKKLDYQPQVFPTARNSIQLEYEKAGGRSGGDYLEFEIFDDRIAMYQEIGGEGFESVISESQLIEIVRGFHE